MACPDRHLGSLTRLHNRVPVAFIDSVSQGNGRVIQEIDVTSGQLLFERRSLMHVGLHETYEQPARSSHEPFYYFHLNSVAVLLGGDLLVSARNTWTLGPGLLTASPAASWARKANVGPITRSMLLDAGDRGRW